MKSSRAVVYGTRPDFGVALRPALAVRRRDDPTQGYRMRENR
jgi:hypothetical protein